MQPFMNLFDEDSGKVVSALIIMKLLSVLGSVVNSILHLSWLFRLGFVV